MNNWEYTLNSEIPVMKEQQRSFQQNVYVMPKEGGHYGIGIPVSTSLDLINCLESVLQQNSHFVVPDQQQMVVDAVKSGQIKDPELVKQVSLEDDQKLSSKKIGAFIHLGGDYIRQGLIQGAKYVSKGIKAGGQFIQTKITKPKEVHVDQKTMQKVRGVKTTSSIMLQYSRAQIEALYHALKTAAKEVGKEVEASDTGVKIKSHKHYEDVVNVGKGTVHAVASVYDGCFEALCEIGRGFSEASVGVIDKQYGSEASEVAKEGLGAVGNVGYIVKSAKDVVTKDIIKDTSNQSYGGVKPQLQ